MRVNPADGSRTIAVSIDEVHQTLAQDGLLGLALHPQLLRGSNYVYVMYTYDADSGAAEERRAKIRRYTYDPASQQLGEPVDLVTNIPHGPDHGASRIVIGPDGKLYASRGDHGSNFLAYYCVPIRAQELPTAADIAARNWRGYEGKILRVNLDGSIPDDNPVLNGVRSHVFSYGHRNPQGLAFGPDGRLYESEHGQDTDDEVNRIEAGRNYGWPLIAGDQGRPVLHLCELVGVGANAVRELGIRPRRAEHGAADEGIRREPRRFHAAARRRFSPCRARTIRARSAMRRPR